MNVHEFGQKNEKVVVLIHPSMVAWDYFERVIPLLEDEFRVMVPAVPGMDLTDDSEFTSVEAIATDLENYLLNRGIRDVRALYGCSMGGSMVLRMAANGRLNVAHYIMDGGITPYQLPRILTRFIAVRDFCTIYSGKLVSEKMLMRAFSSTEYSDEDVKYIANVLKHCTAKTIWRVFDSCNNFAMPKEPMRFDGVMHYWFGEGERKARDWDIKYMRKFVPDTMFHEMKGVDHGDFAYFQAERLAEAIRQL
ncbi:2-hydroxy-6-oxo-6-phenylhexa-2,4-dienoate hydrolase [Slackia heliotrinireducens]|uniref:AB hydrolase-1 domain-containing protein n=1 Tax=Slackia heliotrinireducens (strain ATCC 29202 / DSM 20476 / NCTC 11029 / RHS 1) TaxID=471855 RepID=C7N368_SLAHD|nr:alpha/beta hydrolase [Slackia heliotrinireducens]ACV21589.1 hypothetical protein Shel_05300 [Slackia heliotrinireducens DSM 20476]VEG99118.1 2-hydroxy-6-oxo-6-phenylhexa-2,4-dienoate hydrolase [Slackia heliotrinireducens]